MRPRTDSSHARKSFRRRRILIHERDGDVLQIHCVQEAVASCVVTSYGGARLATVGIRTYQSARARRLTWLVRSHPCHPREPLAYMHLALPCCCWERCCSACSSACRQIHSACLSVCRQIHASATAAVKGVRRWERYRVRADSGAPQLALAPRRREKFHIRMRCKNLRVYTA